MVFVDDFLGAAFAGGRAATGKGFFGVGFPLFFGVGLAGDFAAGRTVFCGGRAAGFAVFEVVFFAGAFFVEAAGFAADFTAGRAVFFVAARAFAGGGAFFACAFAAAGFFTGFFAAIIPASS